MTLSQRTLSDANLTGLSPFHMINLSLADLSGTKLSGANLDDADLSGAILSGAIWNAETKWPEGFTPLKPPEPKRKKL